MQERVTEVAATEGLDYRLDLARPTNSFDAHRLIHQARRYGQQAAMKERLLRAYFTEGRNLADLETLVELADDVGLAGDEVRSMLSSDELTDDVRADERDARTLGISGVPFFVLGRKYGVSGAQPPDTMLEALRYGLDDVARRRGLGRLAQRPDLTQQADIVRATQRSWADPPHIARRYGVSQWSAHDRCTVATTDAAD